MRSAVVAFLLVCVLFASCTEAKKIRPAAPQLNLCGVCIDFMDEALQELIDIIANGGVIGTCGALCSALPNQALATVCDLLCDVVGIDEFLKILQDVDPDPIFYCEELGQCPHRVGAVNITGVYASPEAGPVGSTFTFTVDYTVTNETGTGEILLEVIPPGSDAEPLSDGVVIESLTPGPYSNSFQMQAQPSEDEPFTPGLYTVFFAICEGSCYSPHKWAEMYTNGSATFHITRQ